MSIEKADELIKIKMLSHERQIKRKRRKVVPHFTIQDELIKITIKNS